MVHLSIFHWIGNLHLNLAMTRASWVHGVDWEYVTPSINKPFKKITMKTNLNIFLLAVVLLGTQACGSKSEKGNETEAAAEATEAVTTLTPAERRAKMDEL